MNELIHQNPAIAAIATPVGEGGIAVIRVSGKDAIAIVNGTIFITNRHDFYAK